ncbi:MAG: shikimate dehydrogenase [Hyphomicrobiales bacterium]
MRKTACVIGWPIRHSRSPIIHGYWLKTYGIDGTYDKVAVAPEDVPAFIARVGTDGFVGCNVTIPHKETVARLVHVEDPVTARIGSVNTVYVDAQGRIAGESTDGYGFMAELRTAYPNDDFQTVTLIGAGGAARSVLAALIERRTQSIEIVARDVAKAQTLADLFGSESIRATGWPSLSDALRRTDLLVNTTPLGMTGYPDLEIDLSHLKPGAVVYDLVYVPMETGLLREARQRGFRTLGGLGMLLHQAVPGFERWFGVRPAVTPELRALVTRDIEGTA